MPEFHKGNAGFLRRFHYYTENSGLWLPKGLFLNAAEGGQRDDQENLFGLHTIGICCSAAYPMYAPYVPTGKGRPGGPGRSKIQTPGFERQGVLTGPVPGQNCFAGFLGDVVRPMPDDHAAA